MPKGYDARGSNLSRVVTIARMRIGGGRGRLAADVLLSALAKEEPAAFDHAREVAELAAGLARALGLDRRGRDDVACAAELHDIGKMAIPGEVLAKRGPLDAAERELMRRHTLVGESMIAAAPTLRPVALLVRASHERWDGRGYPDGIEGEAIPLGARIVAVCDAFSAMREVRPYGNVLTEAAALAELRRCAGTQFDPRVVRAFCATQEALPVAV
jgi:HD-GYP domain-containing protein (c-di-GMP phosphodiesterase class II)